MSPVWGLRNKTRPQWNVHETSAEARHKWYQSWGCLAHSSRRYEFKAGRDHTSVLNVLLWVYIYSRNSTHSSWSLLTNSSGENLLNTMSYFQQLIYNSNYFVDVEAEVNKNRWVERQRPQYHTTTTRSYSLRDPIVPDKDSERRQRTWLDIHSKFSWHLVSGSEIWDSL